MPVENNYVALDFPFSINAAMIHPRVDKHVFQSERQTDRVQFPARRALLLKGLHLHHAGNGLVLGAQFFLSMKDRQGKL